MSTAGVVLLTVLFGLFLVTLCYIRFEGEKKKSRAECDGCHGCDGIDCIDDDCDKCIDTNCDFNESYETDCSQCAEFECDGCLYDIQEGDEDGG